MSGFGTEAPSPYPVLQIRALREAGKEAMGSKPKFWYREASGRTSWLFKYPQEGTGQHWAEKIAAEVARAIGVPHAVVELGEVEGRRGSATRSFLSGEETTLLHGGEVLARTMPYDRQRRFGQSSHTLSNIFEALERFLEDETVVAKARLQFAGYVVLDALIGNTDRHHDNWGLIEFASPSERRYALAPSFDHGSSLGRELPERKRSARLEAGTVGRYAEKGRGGIFWSAGGRYGPSPLDLVRCAASQYSTLFQKPVRRVRALSGESLEAIVRRVPADWMSQPARDFAEALLAYNAEEISRCLE